MAPDGAADFVALKAEKFRHPEVTADGKTRAKVAVGALRTLWFNTGTLCNLTCRNCYIESSPTNDRLAYLSRAEVASFLDQARALDRDTAEIGFTGGEPFMNPEIIAMVEDSLARGYRVIVLTNAMKPMTKVRDQLLALGRRWGKALTIRVSIDHYTPAGHELERGARSWQPTIDGLCWLVANGFQVAVAGRTFSGESMGAARVGYADLFRSLNLTLNAEDSSHLVLFPEMDARRDVPEITTACWGILQKSPDLVMCASSRMVVKHRGANAPTVVACTLLPYDAQFDLGASLAGALRPVALNHPHCARFCVLGGASCSAG
jgi:hypothetical protein